MNNLKVRFVHFVFLALPFLINVVGAEQIASDLSVEELKAVAQSIREEEDALLNVRIDSNSWLEKGPSSSGPWEQTPVCWSTTAYYGGISSKQARIDFHKSVLPWKNGASPYLKESYSVSFDGMQGRRKLISSSYNGKFFDRDRGFILPRIPWQLTASDRITGIKASLFFHYHDMPDPFPKRVSPAFEAIVDPNSFLSTLVAADPNYSNIKPAKINVVREEFKGIQCIKVVSAGSPTLDGIWFDPNRGFALLEFKDSQKDKNGNERLASSIEVTKLKKVAENIWWPTEAYFVQCPDEAGKPWTRIVYRAFNVVANDPNFDESIFTIPFPDGYLIDDQITGKKYKVGEDPNAPKEQPNK